jgi:hypothetical protein
MDKYEYFYTGLEARLRENKFYKLEDACRVAQGAAQKLSVPVRIFGMTPARRSLLVGYVDESGAFEEALQES